MECICGKEMDRVFTTSVFECKECKQFVFSEHLYMETKRNNTLMKKQEKNERRQL